MNLKLKVKLGDFIKSIVISFGLLIATGRAFADGAPALGATGGLAGSLPMLVIFVFIFYMFILRPQSKRTKAHQALMSQLSKGDEVVTAAGMLGKIQKISDPYVVLAIAEGVEVIIQKQTVTMVLPKGSLKTALQS